MDLKRMADIRAAVVEDLGGDAEISAVMSALVEDFSFAVVLRDLLSAHLGATGPLTRAGKKKAAYTTWLQASARVEGLARQIGLHRRPLRSGLRIAVPVPEPPARFPCLVSSWPASRSASCTPMRWAHEAAGLL